MKLKPYKEQLAHPLWYEKMEAVFQRDQHECRICGFPNKDKRRHRFWDSKERKLVVHFKKYLFDMRANKYVDPWLYPDACLITLCSWCRHKGNGLFTIPIQKI